MPTLVVLPAGSFELYERHEWKARPTNLAALGDNGDLEPRVYLHHEGGARRVGYTTTVEQEKAVMRAIQAHAIDTKGYTDIDYGVVVFPSGRAYVGRGFQVRPAATLDENEDSEAVCIAGHYDLESPTAASLQTAALVIAMGVRDGELALTPDVRGHRESVDHPGATSCPGRNVNMDAFRARVADVLRKQTPTAQEDDMPTGDIIVVTDHPSYPPGLEVVYVTDPWGVTYRWVRSEADLAGVKADRTRRGQTNTRTVCKYLELGRYGVLVGPTP